MAATSKEFAEGTGRAFAGALYVAMTVAPTDELVLNAARMTDAHAIAAAVVSLVLLHVFVYGAGLVGHPSRSVRRTRCGRSSA